MRSRETGRERDSLFREGRDWATSALIITATSITATRGSAATATSSVAAVGAPIFASDIIIRAFPAWLIAALAIDVTRLAALTIIAAAIGYAAVATIIVAATEGLSRRG
jgi:hypothetical protein